MSEPQRFHGVLATTHIDRHNERFSKEALDEMAKEDENGRPRWVNWNHQTTLPPIGITEREWVEEREDGEYQLVYEGRMLDDGDKEILAVAAIEGLDGSWGEMWAAVSAVQNEAPEAQGQSLTVAYDPRNYTHEEIEPIVRSLAEIVPANDRLYIRKAEIPHPVLWVLLATMSGFFSRFGEIAADKTIAEARKLYADLSKRFGRILDAKQDAKPDVIFGLQVPGYTTIVEGAVEDADRVSLDAAWQKLPELYAVACLVLQRNKADYFSELKFLYNPVTATWDVNFFTIRRTAKVILGPRYYDTAHPLRGRWLRELKEIRDLSDDSGNEPSTTINNGG